MSSRVRIAVRHVVTVIGLLLVIVWLWRLDEGGLDADATSAALTFVRTIALSFAAYLIVLAAVGDAAQLLALPRTTRIVDRLTMPFVRTVIGGAATLGVMGAPPAGPTPQSAPTTTMVAVPPGAPNPKATLHLLSPDEHEAPEASPVITDETWTVQPGDCFWVIAASHLADSRGEAGVPAIDGYWRRLIDANRDRLANPDDPNLLFANQELVLPALDAG